jgi:ABC-type amino acid transport substrate-binding protein
VKRIRSSADVPRISSAAAKVPMWFSIKPLLLFPLLWWSAAAAAAPAATDLERQDEVIERPAATASMIVATRQAPPFAYKDDDGRWTGISIDLWNRIAEKNGFDFRYTELGLTEMLEAVVAARVDAAAAALTITGDRERRLDFSHPFMTAGLAIAVPHRGADPLALISRFIAPGFLLIVAGLLGLLIAVGVLIWLAERRVNGQFRQAPLAGIGSGLWWSAVTMTTVGYGDKAPTTLLGRAIAIAWMFAGLIVISSFTAAITTALTVSELDTSIDGVDDLRLKRVLALAGGTSDAFLTDHGLHHRTVGSLSEALAQLAAGDADAVVHDAPILRFEVRETFPRQLRVLPFTLRPQVYGIALPPGSRMRESVNIALIEIVRSDEWAQVLDKYLGPES